MEPDDILRDDETSDEITPAAAAGSIQLSSISTTIMSPSGKQKLLRITATQFQDYYVPGWYLITDVLAAGLLDAVLVACQTIRGPTGNSYIVLHGQRRVPLPQEDPTGLRGSMREGTRSVGLKQCDTVADMRSVTLYSRAGSCGGGPFGISVAAALKSMDGVEAIARQDVARFEATLAEVQEEQQQQQQQAEGRAAAQVEEALDVVISTGLDGMQHERFVSTLFQVVHRPAAPGSACLGAGSSAAAAAAAAPCVVIAKALLSYQRPVLSRVSPCLELIEVLGRWRGRGIARRLLQVRPGQLCGMDCCMNFCTYVWIVA